jgi:rhomboid protease GluP
LLRFGASEQVHVRAGEYWRLLTPLFLHIGVAHLAVNSYFGFGWCAAIERELGKARFLFIYLVSGVAGGAASVAGHQAVSAGASGAIFGVIGATLILRRRLLPSWRAALDDPPTKSVLINIAILVVLGFTVVPMDHFAHFGGALAGAALAWLLTAPKPSRSGWAAMGLAFVALLLVAIRPGWPSRRQAPQLTEWAGVYYEGKPFGKNDARALKFARRACAAGDPAACGLVLALQVESKAKGSRQR